MQHPRTSIILLALLVAACSLTVSTPTAHAQPRNEPQRITPPQPSKEEDPSFVAQAFVLLVIAAAAIGANMIPSKRGHQD